MNKRRKLALQREYRKRTANICTRRYEKSPRGFLMRSYRNALSRVTGVCKQKAHLYAGLEIMPREVFYEWAWSNKDFWLLYRSWVAEHYNRKLTPSLNRIDPNTGYVLGNVEWVTHSVNSALGASSQRRALYLIARKVLNGAAS